MSVHYIVKISAIPYACEQKYITVLSSAESKALSECC